MTFTSALYAGVVTHQRLRPRRHKLSYKVFSLLVDLDELPTLHREVRGFSHNRFNLWSFYDRDHGEGTDGPLRGWAEQRLCEAGIDIGHGPIRLLCYPRVLGYVFNPLSIYFCYRSRADSQPAAIIYEVNNTFGGRHCYVIPAAQFEGALIRQSCEKELYVSPFVTMAMSYDFRVRPPADVVAVAINTCDASGVLLRASFSGKRQALASAALIRWFLRFPHLTLKVIGAIHWEALKLWIKGVPLVARPQP